MPDFDPTDFENALIEQMRAHDGAVTTGPLAGHPLLVLSSSGAKSNEPRRAILTFSRDSGDYIVAGTAGGSPTTPGLGQQPAPPSGGDGRGREPHLPRDGARSSMREERDRLWDQHVARLPWFADYPSQSGRTIPVIRLTPIERN